MDLKEFFLKQKQATHQGALEVLREIPAGQMGWRPASDMLSLGEMARHVWTAHQSVLTCTVLTGKKASPYHV
jgi:hypothetical protein